MDDNSIDYALAVEVLYDDARFRRASSYAALVATWDDTRPLPTHAQLEAAWDVYLSEENERNTSKDRLDQLRDDTQGRIDLSDYLAVTPAIRTLAQKVAWLEAEIRDLRRLG